MAAFPHRRSFLASSAITVAATLLPRASGQPTTRRVRENVAGMAENHPTLVAYRAAIQKMQALPDTNELSWKYQANMHGVSANPGMVKDWSWCMHGNWWFLPWHRGYIYFFERIVRKMSGDSSFSLPYWSWEQPVNSVLPVPFRKPAWEGGQNYLFDDTRTTANLGNPLRPNPQAATNGSFARDWAKAKLVPRFTTQFPETSFGGIRQPKTALPAKPRSTRNHGAMESHAHDLIHDAVGGNPSPQNDGNMSSPATAANDPIFWLHHANVDRLWNQWLAIRGHANPSESDWHEQQFVYYDADGSRVVLTVDQILTQAAAAYYYDDEDQQHHNVFAAANPGNKPEAAMPQTIVGVAAAQPALKLGTTAFSKALAFDEAVKPKLMAAFAPAVGAEALAANANPPAVLLRIEGIQASKRPKVSFDVYLTKAGEPTSEQTYVGAISFFGKTDDTGHEHGHDDEQGFTQGFDVTRNLQAIRRANKEVLPELQVHIVPHSTAGLSDTDLAKEKIEVPFGNITLKLVTDSK